MSLRLHFHASSLLVTGLGMMFMSSQLNARDISNTGTSNIYGSKYKSIGQCGTFPRISAPTPKWACVGIVAGPSHGLKMPREVLPLEDGSILVTDMVGWKRSGKLWRLRQNAGGAVEAHALFTGLKHPSGLRLGPDGMVYVGEEHRVWFFDPKELDPKDLGSKGLGSADPQLKKTIIVKGLPKKIRHGKPDHYHPISHFIFDTKGDLILNLGSFDDRCERRSRRRKFAFPCPSDKASNMEAGLWKLTQNNATGIWSVPKRFARGLRNSIALASHLETNLLLQAENNVDKWAGTIRSRSNPPEEFNIVLEGKHYGWPYCIGNNRVLPEYRGRVNCTASKYQPPISLLPAHSSPFGMAYYHGALFPELKGKLIVALHGWQPNGHRIAVFDVDKKGRPIKSMGQKIDQFLIKNWTAKRELRPAGRPGGLMVDAKGAIWFTDYKHHTLMVVLRSAP